VLSACSLPTLQQLHLGIKPHTSRHQCNREQHAHGPTKQFLAVPAVIVEVGVNPLWYVQVAQDARSDFAICDATQAELGSPNCRRRTSGGRSVTDTGEKARPLPLRRSQGERRRATAPLLVLVQLASPLRTGDDDQFARWKRVRHSPQHEPPGSGRVASDDSVQPGRELLRTGPARRSGLRAGSKGLGCRGVGGRTTGNA
jgi:hypothetical protein